MAVVERIAHRIAVMYMGEIVEIGSRRDIIENAQHPYTRRLMSAVPVPDPARRQLRRAPDASELPSPIRPADFIPPRRNWLTVGPAHQVQEFA